MTTFQLKITPPPGVRFTQWPDGSIVVNYAVDDVVKIRRMLLDNVKLLHDQAIATLREEKEREIELQKRPLTRLQQIQKQMNQLQAEMKETEAEHFDLDEIRENIENSITRATTEPDTEVYEDDDTRH